MVQLSVGYVGTYVLTQSVTFVYLEWMHTALSREQAAKDLEGEGSCKL